MAGGRLKICDVLLAVIGPSWLNSRDAQGRQRLYDSDDFVRREIAAALRRNDVYVVPVLVSKAKMPRAEDLPDDLKPLVTRQNYELRDERFTSDVADLMAKLAAIVSPRALWIRRIGVGVSAIAVRIWLAAS